VIETDASDFALGCILSQYLGKRLHAVALHSRKLNDAKRNYEIHDKELLAILEAFREWNHYLLGADEPVTVYTDHQNLQYFLTTKVWNPNKSDGLNGWPTSILKSYTALEVEAENLTH